MKQHRNRFLCLTAMLLCLMLLAGIFSMPALSEMPVATPTDLAETEEPIPQAEEPEAVEPSGNETPARPDAESAFSMTETVGDVKITVSADAGVFPADTVLEISAAGDTDFVRAAEAASGTPGNAILCHAQYRFSCGTMSGKALVRLERLDLAGLAEQYPGASLSVFVLQYDPATQAARIIPADTDISRGIVSFMMEAPGLYDILVMILPAPEPPAEEQAGSAADEQPAQEPEVPQEPEALSGEEPPAGLSAAPAGTDEEQDVLSAADEVETDSITAFVTRCYKLILGREPDPEGVTYWSYHLRTRQKTAATVISGFLGSNEFTNMRKTPDELVDILYQTMLDRSSDSSGKKYWLKIIQDGATIAQLVNGFCNSNEFRKICDSYGIESGSVSEKGSEYPAVYTPGMLDFVTRCYRVALDREPESAGLQYWCGRLMQQKSSFKDVAESFMFSNEMNSKHLSDEAFIRKLYNLYLDRDAEPSGLQYWVDNLMNGMTRKEACRKFASATEFKVLMASYELESNHLIIPGDTQLTIKNGEKAQLKVSTDLAPAGTALTWSVSDEKIISVSENGLLFGVYPGQATLTVSTPDGQKVTELLITVQANYRAVLFSESTYGEEGTFYRNQGDVRLMKKALSAVTGPDGGEYTINTFDNLTATEVYEKIKDHLALPARDGDVSLFFFASHGDFRATSQLNAGRMWCRDRESWLEFPTLAGNLSKVEGKVIVILQSCGTGAAVHEWDPDAPLNAASSEQADPDPAAQEQLMAASVISAFSAADPGLQAYRTQAPKTNSGLKQMPNQFLTSKFVVMTACGFHQMSYFLDSNTYNLFPYWVANGIGFGGELPADAYYGNGNGELTVSELFSYAYDHCKSKQKPQLYPQGSDYVLFKRAE